MSEVVATDRADGIGIVALASPPVNALSRSVRAGIAEALERLAADPEVRAIVVHGTGRGFSGGADIREFSAPQAPPLLPAIVAAIEASDRPVVAAMHGVALGGGLELALACHYRVALPGTRLGLPEVKLGIIPGAGGTQRAPRLVGLERAIELITGGEPLSAEAAVEAGLLDRLGDGDDPRAAGIELARELVAAGRGPRRTGALPVRSGEDRSPEAVIAAACARLARRARGEIAPFKALEAVEAALTLPVAEGMRRERALFDECRRSPQRAALVHLFFAERAATRIDLHDGVRPAPVARVGVVGGGTMGSGIAIACADAGLTVTVVEQGDDAAAAARARIGEVYERAVARGRKADEDATAARERIDVATGMERLAEADLVVEAVFESMAAKRPVFEALAAVTPPGTVLATNTSSFDVDAIAAASGRPDRVVGLHFFSPAQVMRLVEVVRCAATSEAAFATAMGFAKAIGKVPVPVSAIEGFVGNRMLFHYGREAETLLEEGATPEQVDRVLTEFGMAMGVFAVRDLSGNDVGLDIRRGWQTRYRDMPFPRVLERLVAEGRLGQKAGRGYYRYEPGDRTPHPDPEVAALIEAVAREKGIARREIPDAEIRDRCLLSLVNEGARLLDRGIARRTGDIDVIYRHGYGFPAWRGGPMFWAEQRGLDEVRARLHEFHARFGAWWAPAPLIDRMAETGGRLSEAAAAPG